MTIMLEGFLAHFFDERVCKTFLNGYFGVDDCLRDMLESLEIIQAIDVALLN